jgi:tetratricopeptide (TPR) repeat protein
MNGTCRLAGVAIVAVLSLMIGSAAGVRAQDAGGAKPQYTIAEYNAYTAAQSTKDPAQQIKQLDDFVSKYPNSALLIYVYPLYYNAYSQQKNFPKVMEYADKALALGDKLDAPARYSAYYARAFAYSNLNIKDTDPTAKDQATKACEAAKGGLKTLGELKAPAGMSDADFAKQKQQPTILFDYTKASCSMTLKDYPTAIEAYKDVLALTPDDPITNYRLGQAYMAMNPPQQMDAFWYFAKAVTSKNANQQQSNQVKSYLRKLLANYQQAGCDNLVDAELSELLQLAGSSAERPASYKLPASADLDAARKDMTIASVITDLKAGGDKGKITWLAACGLEFPDVPGKLIEITPGDTIELKVAFVTSDAEFDAKTTPDMDVKVVGQPDAARLEKDNPVRFTATLTSYDPDPAFMLHWDKAKVNDEDIPKEKDKGKKKRPATKKSSQ